jgi:hypothetical protein
VALLSYADTDAMVELFGHVRAVNPASDVRFRLADELEPDDLIGHVVLLGGLGFKQTAGWFMSQVEMPAEQVDDPDLPHGDPFVLTVDGNEQHFRPVFVEDDPTKDLTEDVGLLVRMPNPLNNSRTLTVCNGVCGRGVLGAVRCLTDANLRQHNEAYLTARFGDSPSFGLLMRVPVLRGNTLTPALNNPYLRLYEWPENTA